MPNASGLRSAGVALFALFFLLLQPICAASERHIGTAHGATAATTHDAAHADDASHGSRDGTPCSSVMRADAMASGSSVATGKSFAAAEIVAASPLAHFMRPGLSLSSHQAPIPPPSQPLSYYARSARILR